MDLQPSTTSVLAGLLALAALAGCRTIDLPSANLEVLHDSKGRHKRIAPIVSGFQFAVRQLIPRADTTEGWLSNKEPKAIEDPAAECFDNMIALTRASSESPSEQATLVRHIAWLAVVDPWSLTRERAVLELGAQAQRLELQAPLRPPEEEANEAELSEAIAGLVQVVSPVIEQAGRATETQARDIQAACAVLEGMELGIEGGRRLLKALAGLSAGSRGEWDAFESLNALNLDVQRRLVAIALGVVLADKSAIVRAAAVEANLRAYGDAFLSAEILLLRQAITQGQQVAYENIEIMNLMELVQAHGLPQDTQLTPEKALDQRRLHLQTIALVATDFTLFESDVRASAMRALGAVSEAGFKSLREEDWAAWWNESLEAFASSPSESAPPEAASTGS